jgi:hypothetical protein
MSIELELAKQATELGTMFMKANDSEIIGLADELLVFLNRLQDLKQQNPKIPIPLSSISDIIYGLESNPSQTLQDEDVRTRLLELFMKLNKS